MLCRSNIDVVCGRVVVPSEQTRLVQSLGGVGQRCRCQREPVGVVPIVGVVARRGDVHAQHRRGQSRHRDIRGRGRRDERSVQRVEHPQIDRQRLSPLRSLWVDVERLSPELLVNEPDGSTELVRDRTGIGAVSPVKRRFDPEVRVDGIASARESGVLDAGVNTAAPRVTGRPANCEPGGDRGDARQERALVPRRIAYCWSSWHCALYLSRNIVNFIYTLQNR